jgi:hypothetical protein
MIPGFTCSFDFALPSHSQSVGRKIAWEKENTNMRVFFGLLLWFFLLVVCWPLALLFIFLLPLVWLITIHFRIVGFSLDLTFQVIRGIVLFPFRLLKMTA